MLMPSEWEAVIGFGGAKFPFAGIFSRSYRSTKDFDGSKKAILAFLALSCMFFKLFCTFCN
jgi:hypothetical protein